MPRVYKHEALQTTGAKPVTVPPEVRPHSLLMASAVPVAVGTRGCAATVAACDAAGRLDAVAGDPGHGHRDCRFAQSEMGSESNWR
jgi:hypothetical protein